MSHRGLVKFFRARKIRLVDRFVAQYTERMFASLLFNAVSHMVIFQKQGQIKTAGWSLGLYLPTGGRIHFWLCHQREVIS